MLTLLLLALQAEPAIVVRGERLEEAYAACAARACPPLRDAQVSIALAERQFRGGRYVEAKRTLAAAAARQRRHAATDPKPAAAINEALATVALHDGDERAYRRAVADQVGILRDHLPAGDPAAIDAALALGDMWVKLRRPADADAAYRTAERQALAAGRMRVALNATVRRAWLASATGRFGEARQLLARLERERGSDPVVAGVLPALRLRLAVSRADDAEVDRLVAGLRLASGAAPLLLWAPPYEPTAAAAAEDHARKFDIVNPLTPRSTDNDPVRWADIGFWIRPDGRTDAIEVLRGSTARAWTDAIGRQIASRRYAAGGGEGPGHYRVERFSLRGTYQVPIGSLVSRRVGARRLEVLDLTDPTRPAG